MAVRAAVERANLFDGATELIPPGGAGLGGDGGVGAGGGIYNHMLENFGGTLTLSDSTLVGNVTKSGGAGRGGDGGAAGSGRRDGDPVLPGMDGPAGQASEGGGGGLFSADGTLRIVQSTIAGNVAAGDGGGVKVGGIDGSATIRNSTIAHNLAGGKGGGLFAGLTSPTLPVELLSTIVAKNGVTAKVKADPDLSGVFFARFNAIGHVGTASLIGAENLLGIDPKLGPLKLNGGPTATLFPAAGSPVFEAGANPAALLTDQRGKPRIIGPAVDVGAVEA